MIPGANPGTDWIDQARRLLDVLRSGTPAGGGSAANGSGEPHASDCRWCPLCQAAAVVRGERPEVTEALADVLTVTAAALRNFAEAGTPTSAAEEPPAEDVDPGPPVQRIEIA
jgi:hypothetical protein